MTRALLMLPVLALLCLARPVEAAPPKAVVYTPIVPRAAEEKRTITLTGHDLSIDDVIAVARYGAKVRFLPEAMKMPETRLGLVEQGNAEGVAIYGRNRGGGALRQVKRAEPVGSEDPSVWARMGALPEIDEEELVRAFLVIQANHLPYGSASADYMQAVCELLNRRVTPVMYSRGTIGEGDLFLTSNYNATLMGAGYAYFRGQRMTAAAALAAAGLKPYKSRPYGILITTNAYTTAIALELVDEGREALEWSDAALAIDLLGMNSSVTPLTPPSQARRPFPWVNWEAAKMLDLLRGSYLFEDDATRILQDPESLRAAHIRLGSAWEAWNTLRQSVLLEMNSGENNPGVFPDVKPGDHWSLATPWLMRQHIAGGALSGGHSGYILSNANWDAYPMVNDIEAFNLAFGNMAVTVAQRIERFSDRGPTAFFTGIKPADVLSPEQIARTPSLSEPYFTYLDVWKEIQTLSQSVVPDSNGSDFGVADIEGVGRLKAARGRQAVDLYFQLLSYDLLAGTYWLDVRKAQDHTRNFGPAATAAWTALREVVPWQMDVASRPPVPYGVIVYNFMKAHPASDFLGSTLPMPPSPPLAVAR